MFMYFHSIKWRRVFPIIMFMTKCHTFYLSIPTISHTLKCTEIKKNYIIIPFINNNFILFSIYFPNKLHFKKIQFMSRPTLLFQFFHCKHSRKICNAFSRLIFVHNTHINICNLVRCICTYIYILRFI